MDWLVIFYEVPARSINIYQIFSRTIFKLQSMINQAAQSLKKDNRNPEVWLLLLKELFDKEKELLQQCSNDFSLYQNTNKDDYSKGETIKQLSIGLSKSRDDLKQFKDMFYSLWDRISISENQYCKMRFFLLESMDNKYYGLDKNGNEIWSGKKPEKIILTQTTLF